MTIRTSTEPAGGTRMVISVDAHTLHADGPATDGSGGTAPTPHDLFDASLATCKAVTVALYARHKGMQLDRVIVEVERDDTREREGHYVLNTKIAFEGYLTEAEVERLEQIAGRCPIQKLMTTATIEVNVARLEASA